MDREKLVRIWFGMVRAAADAGEKEVPEGMAPGRLQKTKIRILTRQDQCDLITLSIRRTEDLDAKAANEIEDRVYAELMEDAIAGVWNEQENLELVRFLDLCSEGIGDTETFCDYFDRALGEGGPAREARDEAAKSVKARADKVFDDLLKERKRQTHPPSSGKEEPPPDMDEFEYIDWLMTH